MLGREDKKVGKESGRASRKNAAIIFFFLGARGEAFPSTRRNLSNAAFVHSLKLNKVVDSNKRRSSGERGEGRLDSRLREFLRGGIISELSGIVRVNVDGLAVGLLGT